MLVFFAILIILFAVSLFRKRATRRLVPTSVNYHFLRTCNYKCGFCFHTAKTTHIAPLDDAKRAIYLLRKEGMQKINFAGGEPFLKPTFLGELCKYSKSLGLAVSIVSNGSKITRQWMNKYGQYVDILAVSCDSFNEATNKLIGRGNGDHLKSVFKVAAWCKEFHIKFKLNTVVNAFNWEEDMNKHIRDLAPFRWKVFQVLTIEGENDGGDSLRDASKFVVTSEQFQSFIERHKEQGPRLVKEDNSDMRTSYLILDEYLRFLDCSGNKKTPSQPILKVGIQKALAQSGWDPEKFVTRGGVYDWTREKQPAPCSSGPKEAIGDIEDLARECTASI